MQKVSAAEAFPERNNLSAAVAAEHLVAHQLLEARYRYLLIALNPNVPFAVDARGNLIAFHQRWSELTGQNVESCSGPGWLHAFHPDCRLAFVAAIGRATNTLASLDIRFRCRTKDGQYRWMRARGKADLDSGPEVRWYGEAEDIHERVVAEEALRESEAHYRYSVELSAQVQWTASADGTIDMAGPRWEAMTGQDPNAILDDGWMKALHPDDSPAALGTWREAVQTGEAYIGEYRVRAIDGSYRWFRSQAAPRRGEDGSIVRWYGTLEDIHERKLAEQALSESEEHYRYSIELSPHRVWTSDPAGLVEEISPKWLEDLGISEEQVLGDGWLKWVHPDDLPDTAAAVETAYTTGTPFNRRLRFRMKDGSYRWQRTQGAPRRNAQGEVVRWYGMNTDIHDLVLAQQALQENEERFRLAAQAAGLGIWDYDAEANRLTWSDEYRRIFGLAADVPAASRVALNHIHPDDRWQVKQFVEAAYNGEAGYRFEADMRIRRNSDGAQRWVTTNGWKAMQADKLSRIIITVRDVTEEKTAEERIRWIATHDALTRLPNRVLFQEELIQAIEHAKDAAGKVGLLLLDVDHFKQINDTLGHDAGDALLQAFAVRMRGSLRSADLVARLGGDEFAIILPDIAGEDAITAAVDSILARLREPFLHAGRIIDCRATIGAALYPAHATEADELLKNADIALYAAKAAGRGRMSVFQPKMREDMQRRASMLFLAREALEKNLIAPHYQPKVHMHSGKLAGFEALLRWSHPRSGVQLPGTIAAAFEDLDLANAISDRMFGCVIADMRRWLDAGLEFGHVAVNASAAEFRHGDLAERILGRLEAAGVRPEYLELEVTESVFLGRGSEHIEQALTKLSEAGVRIALDDFGTGFASLSHLKQFPIDIIKIDRSFVTNIELDQENASIVNAVLSLSQSLGICVVAEGIENIAQADHLKQQGCAYGQGWLYAKAQPAGDIPGIIQNWQGS